MYSEIRITFVCYFSLAKKKGDVLLNNHISLKNKDGANVSTKHIFTHYLIINVSIVWNLFIY